MERYIEKIEKIAQVCYFEKEEEARVLLNDLLETMVLNNEDNEIVLFLLNKILFYLEKNDFVSIGDYLLFGLKSFILNGNISESVIDFSDSYLDNVEMDVFYIESVFEEELVLCAKTEGKCYHFNSYFSPTNEADYCLKELDMKATTPVVVLFGIGTGVVAEQVLNNLGFDGKLLIYEPNNSFIKYCLDCGDTETSEVAEKKIASRIKKVLNDERTVLCVEEESSIFFSRVLDSLVDFTGLLGIKIIRNPGYVKAFPDSFLCFLRTIRDFRDHLYTNRNTLIKFMDEMVENPLKNLKYIRNAYRCSDLKKILPADVPVIIVSAGPSLEKNIKLLNRAKGHALIFAVDSAVKYLLRDGIVPDLTITIDARKLVSNYESEKAKEIPCIFSEVSNPKILELMNGKLIFLDRQEGYMDELLTNIGKEPLGFIGIGGSVATAAFAVAHMLECENIILIGQDLAYEGDNSHAGGMKERTTHEDSFVEDIYGNQIRTRSDWVGYIRWFEDAIKVIKESKTNRRVIDATEGGAKIHGSEILTFKEVLEFIEDKNRNNYEYDFGKELKKASLLLNEEECEEFYNKHKMAINNLKVLENELEDGIRICNITLKEIENDNVSYNYICKQNKKLSTIQDHLEKNPLYILIKRYADAIDQGKISKLELEEGDSKKIQNNMVTIMKLFFEANIEALRKIREKTLEYEYLLET